MRFNIESDDGNLVRLWLAPDNPADVPVLSIWSGHRAVAEISANTMRPDVRDHGLHLTGEAGFTLDESVVPGIAQMADLELREPNSGVPIYARVRADQHSARRVLVWTRPSAIAPAGSTRADFALIYPDLDRLSLETAGAVLDSWKSPSMLAIGRPNLLRFSELLDRQSFEVNFVLTDPYVDVAERLLAMLARDDDAQPAHARMLGALQDTSLDNHRELVRFFRTLERTESAMLRSPVVRALTKSPEEDVRRQDVSVALKVLARNRVVCTEQTLHLFTAESQLVATPPEILSLSERLRQIEPVSDLLNEDLALYHYVGLAVAVAHKAMLDKGAV